MNRSASYAMAAALAVAKRDAYEMTRADELQAEVRLCPPKSAGWYFVRAGCARWYAMAHEGDDHFTRAESADIESAIEAGAAVLLTGFHARPIRLWETWAAFADDVKGGNR